MKPSDLTPDRLTLNGKAFYFDEIAQYSFRNSIEINGYEAKVLELCRNWLTGVQEFPLRTSGSTGTPKTIVLTRDQLEASARRTINLLGLQPGDRTLVCLNTEYIGGLMMLVRGLVGQLPLFIIEPTAQLAPILLQEAPFAFASFVPLQLQELLQAEQPEVRQALDAMKAILVGGAPLKPELQAHVQQLRVPIYHTYGMTETASHIGLRRLNGPEPDDAYTAFPEITLGQDDRGCLTISGEITNGEKLVTNDLVELLPGNKFKWLGRADNVINSGGYKVQAEKVETALAAILASYRLDRRLVVIGLPDERLGQQVAAVLEGEPLAPEEEERVLTDLRAGLHPYETPKRFLYKPSLPQTATAKIDRVGILQQLLAGDAPGV